MPIVFILIVAIAIPLAITGVAAGAALAVSYLAPVAILILLGWGVWTFVQTHSHFFASGKTKEMPTVSRKEYVTKRIAILEKQRQYGLMLPEHAAELADLQKETALDV